MWTGLGVNSLKKNFFIGKWLIYNVVLAPGIQQSESVLYLHIFTHFFRFFSHVEFWVEFPVLYGSSYSLSILRCVYVSPNLCQHLLDLFLFSLGVLSGVSSHLLPSREYLPWTSLGPSAPLTPSVCGPLLPRELSPKFGLAFKVPSLILTYVLLHELHFGQNITQFLPTLCCLSCPPDL